MDRGRGNFHRGGYSKNFGSSNYSSRGNDNHRSRGSHNDWSHSSDTRGGYSGQGFFKRKYDQSNDHRKSYNDGMYYEEGPPQKHFHSGNNNYEGRSNNDHQRPSYQGPSQSRGRSNYHNEGHRGRSSSDSYRHVRRVEEDRSYSKDRSNDRGYQNHGFANSSRLGRRGNHSSRGGGRDASHNNSYKPKEHRSSKMDRSRSPSQRNSSTFEDESDSATKKERSNDDALGSPSKDTETQEIKTEDMQSDKISLDISIRTPRDDGGEEAAEASEDPDAADPAKSLVDEPHSRSRNGDRKEYKHDGESSRKNKSRELPDHFIRLQCPHCHQRSITFKDYIDHLRSSRHLSSLERLSRQHSISLSKLRARQRQEQSQMEAQSTRPTHSSRMNYCAICKLYHSESRPNHETTELHKIIKNFLMPYCSVCKMHFLSRMIYEKHVATLPHLKNKANLEKTLERKRQQERHDRSGSGTNEGGIEVELDLNSYTTLDAVGSVDGEGEDALALEEDPVGRHHIRKVEVHYCDICQRYLSRAEPTEKVIELHCRTRIHHRALEERQNGDKKVADDDIHPETTEEAENDASEAQPAENKDDWCDLENPEGDHAESNDGFDTGDYPTQGEDDNEPME